MILCSKCGKELSESATLCDGCGAQINETILCHICGKQTSVESSHCQFCSALIHKDENGDYIFTNPSAKKRMSKKLVLVSGAAIIAIAVIVLIIFGVNSESDMLYALYSKEQNVFFADLKKSDKALKLTTRLVDDDEVDDEELTKPRYTLGFSAGMSKNTTLLFFPDKIHAADGGCNLFYRNTKTPEKEAVKISSGVVSYTVNDSATIVTYLKSPGGELYQYILKSDERHIVDSEVKKYRVSDDGAKIVYVNSEGSIYLKYKNKDKEKLASGVSGVVRLTDDLTTIFYIKDNSLYKQVEGEDRIKIASGVYDVIAVYDSGEAYYIKNSPQTIKLADYVQDDMLEPDSSLVRPERPPSPSRPWSWEFDTTEEYDAAFAVYEEELAAREAYEKAYEEYQDKQNRDILRAKIADATIEYDDYTLYFFDNIEETAIANAFIRDNTNIDYTTASDAPVIAYAVYKESAIDKIKLSEIESVSDVEEAVETVLFSTSERYVAIEKHPTVIDQEDTRAFKINATGTLIYYLDTASLGIKYGELYRILIKDKTISKPELYDDNVHSYYCRFISENQFLYFKDYYNGVGELCIDKKRVDYSVMAESVHYDADSENVVYLTEWSDSKEYGILKVFTDGSTKKVSDDVHGFSVTPDGRILYLYDYIPKYYKGELREWNKKGSRKIDDDVVTIIPVFDASAGEVVVATYSSYGAPMSFYLR